MPLPVELALNLFETDPKDCEKECVLVFASTTLLLPN